MPPKYATQEDKSRVQSTQAEKTGGETPKDSFPARFQSAADKNTNTDKTTN